MSYIDRNLLPGEKILFRTRKHLIIFLIPAAFSIFAVYSTAYMQSNFILARLDFLPWAVALLLWACQGLEYVTSEFVVTDKRVMMREGFFFRHTNELRLATISQVSVSQSLIGQLLNYGTVSINAFGAFDTYVQIDNPFVFQRQVNGQLDTIVK